MNLLLLEPHEIRDGVATVSGRRAEHLLKVLKVTPGRELRTGVIDVGSGLATVRHVSEAGEVEIEVDVATTRPLDEIPPIDLIVALPRPQALHRILQSTAAMSVRRLYLTNSWRVEKSFFSSPSLRPETVRRHLLLGAEQGMVTRLPDVRIEKLLVPFLTRFSENSTSSVRLIADPGAKAPIESRLGTEDHQRPVVVAIGPEGGWIDREIETFGTVGFEPVWLGPWILRVETAVAAALAQVALLRRTTTPEPDESARETGSRDNLDRRSETSTPEES